MTPRRTNGKSHEHYAPYSVTYGGADHSTEHGSRSLAKRIEQFWAANGHPGVKCEQITTADPERRARPSSLWHVRSNLVSVVLPEGVK